MKKIILVMAFALWTFSSAFAQEAVASNEELTHFYKTKTYIVYDNNMFGAYNGFIKEAVEKGWTITDYEFLELKDLPKKIKDPNASFLVRTKVWFDKDKSNTSYTFLSLMNGNKKARSVNDLVNVCSFPLSYYNVDYDKYVYKLGAVVLFVQNHVNITKENSKLTSKNILRHYNKNTLDIGNKVLYLVKDELAKDVNTLSKIKAYYDGKVKIVTREEVQQAIKEKNEQVIFLHKVGPDSESKPMRVYKLLIGAADGKLYYFNYHKIKAGKAPDGFLAKDFKKIK